MTNVILLYYDFYLKYLFTSCQLRLLITCQWVSHVQRVSVSSHASHKHALIEEDIHVTP